MRTAASHAAALNNFYQNIKSGGGSASENAILENAQRVSTPLATMMLSQMGLGNDTNVPFKLLENACGVGVVAPVLQRTIEPEVLKQSSILCGDFSDQAIDLVKKRITSEGWLNTEASRVDAQKTGLADGAFTHVATNIGFHVVPDSEAALHEAIRVLQPGGVLGLTTWHKEPGWMVEVKKAFKSFPFEAPSEMPMQTTPWGDWSDVNWIRKTLVGKGLQDVKVDVFAYLTHVDSAEFFLVNFGAMIDVIMNGCWSEQLRKKHPRDEVHAMMRELLEKKYGGDGWDHSWIAIIASGKVPADARV
ncbi:S-adenosyl-L-methionine-dependent methyltransferase [Achaetomium macrosporum]|uniref:S-adenosyl-L-methionine-dependent methyltransferase n=1 Tax=Achaetomium macrosporum TaxID=79813 RepID=A0AAN7C0E9_9PEZI|nr:S-adenosyl-L-methionine-dependent methyltransferase [Achaetomium macrosporum]